VTSVTIRLRFCASAQNPLETVLPCRSALLRFSANGAGGIFAPRLTAGSTLQCFPLRGSALVARKLAHSAPRPRRSQSVSAAKASRIASAGASVPRRDAHSRRRHCGRVQPFPPCNGDTFQYRVRGTAVALPHSDRRAWRGHPGYQRAMLAPGGCSHLLLSKVRPAIYSGIPAGFALSGTYGGCHGSASRR